MGQLSIDRAIVNWMDGVFAANAYVDEQAPWALRKTDPDRMMAVLGALFIGIRDLAIAIQPIIPTAAGKLLDQMGIPHPPEDTPEFLQHRGYEALDDTDWYEELRTSGFRLGQPVGIFPRLEMPAAAEA
jgi:methionyl-tRNA synthetase